MTTEHEDRLSELPDSLIFHILWFLPMRDVVMTSLLARRWKSLWRTTPYLNFDHWREGISLDSRFDSWRSDVPKFITRALLSWRGKRILKMKIDLLYSEESLCVDFNLWMRLAVEKKAEELYLHGYEYDEDLLGYKVPQWLYSCSWLKQLSLRGCDMQISGNVQWTQLKSLSINTKCFSNYGGAIEQVLCGAPQLEVLNLGIRDTDQDLTIRSSSLRKFTIEALYPNPCMVTELRIWTPNLKTLELLGCRYTLCLLMDVSALTHVNLDFYVEYDDERHDFFLEETLMQILPRIQHVEMVSISSWCFEIVARMAMEDMISSPLSNVKLINIKAHCEEVVEMILHEMKIEVVLVERDRSEPPRYKWIEFDGKSCMEFYPQIFPKLQLLKLGLYALHLQFSSH